MRIFTAKLKYGTKLTIDEQALFHQCRLRGGEDITFEEDGTSKHSWTEFFFDLDTLPNVLFSKFDDMTLAFVLPTADIENVRGTVMINKVVNVAVPGAALLGIKEVQVLTDSCTDRLRDELNSGWQIIAVCPQPDQRRPDYVLGRS